MDNHATKADVNRILKRLDQLEAAMLSTQPKDAEQQRLLSSLEKLTLKRHAVLTATLGGMGYQELAELLGVDVTTVKLQLRSALITLGIANRSMLMVQHSNMLDQFTDKDYEKRFGISKRWWLTKMPPELSAVLLATKPARNQHTP